MKDLDILILAYYDWSNAGWNMLQCFKSLGFNVMAYKGAVHHFNYPFQIPIHSDIARSKPICKHPIITKAPKLRMLMEHAKVIYFIAETYIDAGVDLKSKKVVVNYGGSTYRLKPEPCNAVFNRIADASIMLFPTLLNKGAKNEYYIPFSVDTEFLQPNYKKRSGKLIIGHFPSSPESKGTEVITKVINKLKKTMSKKFEYIGLSACIENGTYIVSQSMRETDWCVHLKNVNKCDIIIETVKPELMGLPFGEWGNAAVEAAAMGKIVVTNSIYQDIYKREYGDSELCIANDAEQLEQQLIKLLNMPYYEIVEKQKATRKWVVEKHSFPAIAKQLWEKVFKDLLPDVKVNE